MSEGKNKTITEFSPAESAVIKYAYLQMVEEFPRAVELLPNGVQMQGRELLDTAFRRCALHG